MLPRMADRDGMRFAYRVTRLEGTTPPDVTVGQVLLEHRFHGPRKNYRVGAFDGQRVERVGIVHLRYIGKQTTT